MEKQRSKKYVKALTTVMTGKSDSYINFKSSAFPSTNLKNQQPEKESKQSSSSFVD